MQKFVPWFDGKFVLFCVERLSNVTFFDIYLVLYFLYLFTFLYNRI